MKVLSPITHGLVLVAAVVAAFLFESVPVLSHYSLQAVALTVLVFFLIKILSTKNRQLRLLPRYATFELTLITFALLLCIGGTGNLSSPLFFLTYLHLFIIVLSTYPGSAITTGLAITWYHYALNMDSAGAHISTLLSIPIMLAIFLYAKNELEHAQTQSALLDLEEKRNSHLEKTLEKQAQKIAQVDDLINTDLTEPENE